MDTPHTDPRRWIRSANTENQWKKRHANACPKDAQSQLKERQGDRSYTTYLRVGIYNNVPVHEKRSRHLMSDRKTPQTKTQVGLLMRSITRTRISNGVFPAYSQRLKKQWKRIKGDKRELKGSELHSMQARAATRI
jgi:hypothetical protein